MCSMESAKPMERGQRKNKLSGVTPLAHTQLDSSTIKSNIMVMQSMLKTICLLIGFAVLCYCASCAGCDKHWKLTDELAKQ